MCIVICSRRDYEGHQVFYSSYNNKRFYLIQYVYRIKVLFNLNLSAGCTLLELYLREKAFGLYSIPIHTNEEY